MFDTDALTFIIIVALTLFFVWLSRRGDGSEPSPWEPFRAPRDARDAIVEATLVASTQQMDRRTEKYGFELIRRDEPGFDEQDFRDRVAWLFLKVHHAITDQDLARVRDFTDDKALASLQARIERSAGEGHAELFKGLRIESMQPVSVTLEGPDQRVVLHIVASAARCVVDRRTGRLVQPDTNGDGIVRHRFTEAWALTRPAPQTGPQTTAAPRPRPYRCPFCGGPVEEGHRYVCTYCGTDLRGPEREWTIRTLESA